jgi:RNA polymerase sigma factor (sigma-70 family)
MRSEALCREGVEADALLTALEQVRPRLKLILASFRLSKEDAEDLLQDLVVIAIQKLPEIENLTAWLRGTTVNLCLMRVRRKHAREKLTRIYDSPIPPVQEPVDDYVDLKRALALLSARHRQVVVLRAMQFSSDEITSRTGYCRSSIRRIRDRAVARMIDLRVNMPGFPKAGRKESQMVAGGSRKEKGAR